MVEPSGWIHISLLNQVRQQMNNTSMYIKINYRKQLYLAQTWLKFYFLHFLYLIFSHLLSFKRTNEPISTFMIQIAVLANHQNGRDTHMRQIKVFTPVEESSIGKFPRCTTVDFMMYRTIRWFLPTSGSFKQSPGPGLFTKLQQVCHSWRKWCRLICVAAEMCFVDMWSINLSLQTYHWTYILKRKHSGCILQFTVILCDV